MVSFWGLQGGLWDTEFLPIGLGWRRLLGAAMWRRDILLYHDFFIKMALLRRGPKFGLGTLFGLAWRPRQRPTEMLSKVAPELPILEAAAAAD